MTPKTGARIAPNLPRHSLTHSLAGSRSQTQTSLHIHVHFSGHILFVSFCLPLFPYFADHSLFICYCVFISAPSLSLLFSFCLLMQFANRERERVANFGVDSGCCCCCCCCSANGRLIMTRGSSNREREREGVQRTSNGARPFCWYGNVRCVQYYCWRGLSGLAC